jgi:hypothetical protein
MDGMRTRKIQVKNGRLLLNEPTDLPDGAEVEVLVIEDDLTAEERAELHASLDRALDDSEAGRAPMCGSSYTATSCVVPIVVVDEAQERFEAEDRWWREHRDAKGYACSGIRGPVTFTFGARLTSKELWPYRVPKSQPQ